MKFLKNNWNLILYFIVVCSITVVMFHFIDKKEGFHEDEIFSYGASNCKYSNLLLSYRQTDDLDSVVKKESVVETLKIGAHYLFNMDEYNKVKEDMGLLEKHSIWRTREDANEYVKIDTADEALDFFTVYWNTARDVHPPLFYFVVHIFSIFFFNNFSKYIIFWINLIFFIGICVLIRKILNILNMKHLSVRNFNFIWL